MLISFRWMRSSDDLIWNLLRVPQAGNPRHTVDERTKKLTNAVPNRPSATTAANRDI